MGSSSPSSARCPSCGRFVGIHDRCPHCGAEIGRRIALRTVKAVVLALTLLGLLGLWWMARHTEIPLITVAEATGTVNMGYVRLQGTVVRGLHYDADEGYLAFWLDDGTGEAYIAAYRDVAAALLASDRVPAPGDEVEVAGTVRVRGDFLSLTLNAADQLTLHRAQPIALEAAHLTRLDEGERVVMQGEITELRSPYEGLTLITLADGTGETTVAVDETAIALGGPLPTLTVGSGMVVTGTVTLYHDRPQLAVATTADLRLLPAPPEAAVARLPIAEVDASSGRVRLRGEVVALEGFRGGLRGTLADESGTISLVLWENLFEALPDPTAFDVGALVEVEGSVKRYNGALEIVPDRASAITILQPAPPLPLVSVAELSAADEGRLVRLGGVLGRPKPFSAGVKVVLDDGSGQITVLLWSSLAEAVEPQPAEGVAVVVVGIVQRYRGELEVVPRTPLDWRPAAP